MGSILWNRKPFIISCHLHPFQPLFIPQLLPFPIVVFWQRWTNFTCSNIPCYLIPLHLPFSLPQIAFSPGMDLSTRRPPESANLLLLLKMLTGERLIASPLCFLHVLWTYLRSSNHTGLVFVFLHVSFAHYTLISLKAELMFKIL